MFLVSYIGIVISENNDSSVLFLVLYLLCFIVRLSCLLSDTMQTRSGDSRLFNLIPNLKENSFNIHHEGWSCYRFGTNLLPDEGSNTNSKFSKILFLKKCSS